MSDLSVMIGEAELHGTKQRIFSIYFLWKGFWGVVDLQTLPDTLYHLYSELNFVQFSHRIESAIKSVVYIHHCDSH